MHIIVHVIIQRIISLDSWNGMFAFRFFNSFDISYYNRCVRYTYFHSIRESTQVKPLYDEISGELTLSFK